MRQVIWFSLWSLFVSCSPQASGPLESRTDSIIGGTPTGTSDPEVFALLAPYPFCTATLIHPRVLLTAAHCVRDQFSAVTNDPQGYFNGAPYVRSTWTHPSYDTTGLQEYDIALVLLQSPITSVPPKAIPRAALPATIGPGRAVGYGQRSTSGTNPPYGERYTINLPVTQLTGGQVRYGSPGAAICFGDSGGPFFVMLDGVETQVAVHSYTNDQTCSGGAGARVDVRRPDIDAWFATNVCPRDGQCDPACLVTDFDCTCAPDGQCTAACTRPELDPDCPANCGSDGVCAAQACPVADVDCRLAGARCERADQCAGQRCTNDPQHPDSYCSMACANDAACAGLDQSECVQGTCRLRQLVQLAEGAPCQPGDRCANGTQCHGLDGTHSFCEKPCSRQSDCPADKECRAAFSTWKACLAKPPAPVTLVSASSSELPAAANGCSTSGSLMLLALAAWPLRTARCRRRAGRDSRTCAEQSR